MKVKVSCPNMVKWRASWPGSKLGRLDGVWFEFASNGDLVDMGYDTIEAYDDEFGGPEMLALSQAAQAGEIGHREE